MKHDFGTHEDPEDVASSASLINRGRGRDPERSSVSFSFLSLLIEFDLGFHKFGDRNVFFPLKNNANITRLWRSQTLSQLSWYLRGLFKGKKQKENNKTRDSRGGSELYIFVKFILEEKRLHITMYLCTNFGHSFRLQKGYDFLCVKVRGVFWLLHVGCKCKVYL